jgi:hypothetical protein
MSPATQQILQAAMTLTEGERWELISALLAEEPPAEGPSPDAAYLDEIRRRSAEIESGVVESTPWSIVRERVWRRVEGRSRD